MDPKLHLNSRPILSENVRSTFGQCCYEDLLSSQAKFLVKVDDSVSGQSVPTARILAECDPRDEEMGPDVSQRPFIATTNGVLAEEVVAVNGVAKVSLLENCKQMRLTVVSEGYANGKAVVSLSDVGMERPMRNKGQNESPAEINLSLSPRVSHFLLPLHTWSTVH